MGLHSSFYHGCWQDTNTPHDTEINLRMCDDVDNVSLVLYSQCCMAPYWCPHSLSTKRVNLSHCPSKKSWWCRGGFLKFGTGLGDQLHALATLTTRKKSSSQSCFTCIGNQKNPEPVWNWTPLVQSTFCELCCVTFHGFHWLLNLC